MAHVGHETFEGAPMHALFESAHLQLATKVLHDVLEASSRLPRS